MERVNYYPGTDALYLGVVDSGGADGRNGSNGADGMPGGSGSRKWFYSHKCQR